MANRTKKRANRLPVLRILSILLMLAAAGVFIIELVSFSQREDRLAADVTVGGVPVGGFSQQDAIVEWERVYAEPVTLYYGNSPIILEPNSIDFRPNSDTMLANALSSSAGGNSFWIRFFNYLTGQEIQGGGADVPLIATYQAGLLRATLDDIAARYDQGSGRAGYDVPTLTVYPGTEGSQLDIDAALVMIDQALRSPTDRTVMLPTGGETLNQPNIDTLRDLIIDYLDGQGFIFDGQTTVASVFIMDLQTGEEINLLGDVAFSAASTIKFPILIDFYRSIDREPTQDEAFIMANSLLCSRNSSSNLLMEFIGDGDLTQGVISVTENAQYLGATNTFIRSGIDEGTGRTFQITAAPATNSNPDFNTDPDPLLQTTAEDMGTLYNLVYDCAEYGTGLMTAYPNGEFTQNECSQMIELMSANDLLRLLQGGIPEGTRISHKNGWLTSMVGDAGIVFSPNGRNYIISVYLWEEAEFQDFERLWPLVEDISRAAWNYFNPDEALLTARDDIPRTAQDCEGNYLPPTPDLVDLNDINGWREGR